MNDGSSRGSLFPFWGSIVILLGIDMKMYLSLSFSLFLIHAVGNSSRFIVLFGIAYLSLSATDD